MDTSPDHIYPARAAHVVTEEDKEQENEESTNLEKLVGVNYDFPQSNASLQNEDEELDETISDEEETLEKIILQ